MIAYVSYGAGNSEKAVGGSVRCFSNIELWRRGSFLAACQAEETRDVAACPSGQTQRQIWRQPWRTCAFGLHKFGHPLLTCSNSITLQHVRQRRPGRLRLARQDRPNFGAGACERVPAFCLSLAIPC